MMLPWGLSWWDVYVVGFLGFLLSTTVGTALTPTVEERKYLADTRDLVGQLPFSPRVVSVALGVGMVIGAVVLSSLWPGALTARFVVWVRKKTRKV